MTVETVLLAVRKLPKLDVSTINDMSFSEKVCIEAIIRAQNAIAQSAAVADINRVLGTRVSSVPLVYTYCGTMDVDQKSGSPYPVMWLGDDALSYLDLHPDIEGVQFRWVLGVWIDPVMGPVPTLFMGSRNQEGRERVLAAVWPFTKCREGNWVSQEERFLALMHTTLDHSQPDEALVQVSEIAIMVQRSTGGLDLKTTHHFIPLKRWRSLELSVRHNAAGRGFLENAPAWPFTHGFEGGLFGKSQWAAGFQFWY